MFQPRAADSSIDVFKLSNAPLKVANIDTCTNFQESMTRVQHSLALEEHGKQQYENYFAMRIKNKDSIPTYVSPSDYEMVDSEHYYRNFAPYILPSTKNQFAMNVPFDSYLNEFPQINCEVPTTLLKPMPKVFHKETINPVLNKPLPLCDVCTNECSYPLYSSKTNTICSLCYENGRFPQYSSSIDFYPIKEKQFFDGQWTLEETNKLLSIIEELGDNWQEVSKQMKNRTPSECFLHFVRLPMYDPYFNTDATAVPADSIPNNIEILPFIVANQPIAAYVQFIHMIDNKLGHVVANAAHDMLDNMLHTSSTNMPFTRIAQILTDIIDITKKYAKERSDEMYLEINNKMEDLTRSLQRSIDERFMRPDHNLRAAKDEDDIFK